MATVDLFNQFIYQPKNKSVLRMIQGFELKYDPIFSKVKTQWLPAIRDFLRDETGLRLHQKTKGIKLYKDTNLSFYFVTDRENKFIQLIDENYPDLDFDEYASFTVL